ncbi:YceH family protein [Planctobacterium marinum]|uniref:UPF0502 protein n=1 Tax=Planctobacterium marinum TaxID=1631968 RepID=A0AA48KQK0_9ALTE|nr:UPF0502 protein [Planctobacterium marinum]
MIVQLDEIESRIIGVLLEKEITTPEQYPLSLNGLTVGCNQKSNREPVMQLSEIEVQSALDSLKEKRQIIEDNWGSRVSKYKHKFCNTEFGSLKFTPQQTAIVCLLLLRGAQTPGELRTRSGRLAEFTDVNEVENTLQSLMDFNQEQLVEKLPREPGKRESRYRQCFSDAPQNGVASFAEPSSIEQTEAPQTSPTEAELVERVSMLESQVEYLTKELTELKSSLGE